MAAPLAVLEKDTEEILEAFQNLETNQIQELEQLAHQVQEDLEEAEVIESKSENDANMDKGKVIQLDKGLERDVSEVEEDLERMHEIAAQIESGTGELVQEVQHMGSALMKKEQQDQ